jgi:hypothetical protein
MSEVSSRRPDRRRVLEHRSFAVIGRVRCGIRLGQLVLDVEFPRLDDDETDRLGRNRQSDLLLGCLIPGSAGLFLHETSPANAHP